MAGGILKRIFIWEEAEGHDEHITARGKYPQKKQATITLYAIVSVGRWTEFLELQPGAN